MIIPILDYGKLVINRSNFAVLHWVSNAAHGQVVSLPVKLHRRELIVNVAEEIGTTWIMGALALEDKFLTKKTTTERWFVRYTGGTIIAFQPY